MGKYYHTSSGRLYGPSNEYETLDDYKIRVRKAYGSLSGIKFGMREDFKYHA